MSSFLTQLRWQFVLLQKNKIVSISIAVTLVYGLLLFFLRDVANLNDTLVILVLNDPSVIGYFFIALSIYTEIKYQILSAVIVTPVNIHLLIITKVLTLSIVGVACSLGLAFSALGLHLDIFSFVIGSMGICVLSALLGLVMLTFASEFLKFTMLSIPVFLVFVNVPLLQYLSIIDLGIFQYLFPIQSSLNLIDFAINRSAINHWYVYLSMIVFISFFYFLAYRRFYLKIVS